MSDLLILQNITREGPGQLADILDAHQVKYDVVDLGQNQALPSLDKYKALVVLGGPDSANDTTAKMLRELAYIRDALSMKLPYLGICLGLQTLVKAAGGTVVQNAVKEIGFHDHNEAQYTVEVIEAGRTDPLLNGLPQSLNVFQLHGETVDLTPGMVLLANSQLCTNQVVRVAPKAYGIQSHFELTSEMLSVWAQEDPDLVPIGNDKLQSDFSTIQKSYLETGRTLLSNFLKIAGIV